DPRRSSFYSSGAHHGEKANGQPGNGEQRSNDVKPNPSCTNFGPFAWWILNRPGRDLMVDADTCRHPDYNYERIADCTRCGKLAGDGMDTIHHSKDYASCQSANDHYRHVRIESAVGMLMEFNIGRYR